jgi:diacylglycerol O-acyltransferase 2, plant
MRDGGAGSAGLIPHGVLPTALPTTCNSLVHMLPAAIGECYALATSTVFWMPIMRHVWWYLDLRPASRSWFHKLLSEGKSVGLSPGGVQECLYMSPGREVAFISKRLGFVRVALQHGCVHPCALR